MKTAPELEAKRAQVIKELNAASNTIKLCVGIGNNAAWMACLDANGRIKKHPRYSVRVKGGKTVGAEFKKAFKMFRNYELDLLWGENNRFFHIADMTPETRALYGDITDREYYDFWAAFGCKAYQTTLPFFTSLVNKIRLAYVHHNYANPEITAWAVGAGACLDLAVAIYNSAIRNTGKASKSVTAKLLPKVFGKFDLSAISEQWYKAVNLLEPDALFKPDDTDQRNIQLGYEQLAAMWMDENTLFGSRIETAQDYAEVFRTNGTCKKVMKEFARMRDSVTSLKS